jgi:hypothetical protein
MAPSERVAERFLQSKTPTYTAVFLDDESKRKLLSWWKSENGDLLPVTYADHMTIQFRPSEDEVAKLSLGEEATLHVVGWAADDRGQAILVRSEVPSSNQNPHITVATAKGTSPVYSNKLLAQQGHTKVSGPTLRGVIDYR